MFGDSLRVGSQGKAARREGAAKSEGAPEWVGDRERLGGDVSRGQDGAGAEGPGGRRGHAASSRCGAGEGAVRAGGLRAPGQESGQADLSGGGRPGQPGGSGTEQAGLSGRGAELEAGLAGRGQDPSLILAFTVIGVTIALLALKNMNSRRRQLVITLKNPETKYLLSLIEKEQISHNTRRFRFALPSSDHVLGLPIGNYIHLMANIDGVLVIRAYTPVSSDDDRGFVDLIIKIYFRNAHPNYPEGGKMSQYLENMKIGDTILCRGPSGRLFYRGPGKLSIKAYKTSKPEEKLASHLGMIAGGTGITPMLQLIRHITKNPRDKTRMSLIFANQTEDDILMRKELEEVAKTHPEQFSLWYTLDRPPAGWKYSSGFITADMIKEHLPAPGKSTFILVCGPPALIQSAAHPSLEQLGYTNDMVFTY